MLIRGNCVASPSGPRKLFKGVTTATSGVLARFPLLLPVLNSFASYGASAVTRTSDRGHVAEAKDQCHRSQSGFLIRVSKETLLILRVYLSTCKIRLEVLVSRDLFRVLSTNSKQAFWADLMVGR